MIDVEQAALGGLEEDRLPVVPGAVQEVGRVRDVGPQALAQGQVFVAEAVGVERLRLGREGAQQAVLARDDRPQPLAQVAGVRVPPTTQLLVGETDKDHVFVQEEQMMPFVPFVRVKDVDEAIDLAIQTEHGYRHTAIIHSRNLDTITKFGRRANVTVFVANGPSMSGLGLGGQGYLSYSISTPTGEGITTPLTFTRNRRIMMTGSLRMI